jgi:hypothetical protein
LPTQSLQDAVEIFDSLHALEIFPHQGLKNVKPSSIYIIVMAKIP